MDMNFKDILKNVSELEPAIRAAKEKFEKRIETGTSGGGLVEVTLSGTFKMLSVKIDPIAVDSRDVPMLQDLIKAAHNDAVEKLQRTLPSQLFG